MFPEIDWKRLHRELNNDESSEEINLYKPFKITCIHNGNGKNVRTFSTIISSIYLLRRGKKGDEMHEVPEVLRIENQAIFRYEYRINLHHVKI